MPKSTSSSSSRAFGLRVGVTVLVWTAIVAGMAIYAIFEKRFHTMEVAKAEARTHFNRNKAFRHWVASHGGVYVPTDQHTPPNPHLAHVKERDITTPSGIALTLMNPAYVARQVDEDFSAPDGTRIHITSLKPLRPENGPDAWERDALEALERGVSEVSETTQLAGRPHLRLMRPLITQQKCLKCHGRQGYQVGDIRGGIAVSIPITPLLARQRSEIGTLAASLGTLWLLGCGAIALVSHQISRRAGERKQAEAALRKLTAAVEQSPATVVITDTQGTIEYVNPRYTETTGYTAEEALGQNARTLKSSETPSEVYEELWKTICEGNVWRGELHNRKKNDELYWESASVSPIFDAEGEITHFLAVKEDITKRKKTEHEMRDYSAALISSNKALEEFINAAEAANQAKSEFLANMSHEIRTPMTAILGFSEVLLGNLDDEGNLEAAATIKRNGEYLLHLINDILDLSKIEAGKYEIESSGCSPVKLINDVMALMRVRADAKNLPLSVEYASPLPEVIHTDPTRLRQILINLIGNAVKFTEVGEIRLVISLSDAADERPCLRFDVIDTGVGIAAEQIPNLFDPFTQADSSTSRKFGGTGLGLAISKRLAEMLGGDIAVSSRPGRGSTFSLTIDTGPLDDIRLVDQDRVANHDSIEKTGAATAKDISLDGCQILLAEDGPDNQRLVSFVLTKAGAEVSLAENGQIAVEMVLEADREGCPFDLVLMDMQMPILDGYEATHQLRQSGCKIPIIALTANTMAGDREKCLAAGCDDFASKPIDRTQLFETIQRQLAVAAEQESVG